MKTDNLGAIGHLKAVDIMTKDVVCLNEDLPLHECERMLLDNGISGAPVIDTTGRLRGVVSKTDLVSYHADQADEDLETGEPTRIEEMRGAHVVDFNTASAQDVMTPVPCVAPETSSIAELAALMVRREVHRVLICRGQKVVGIVSSMDILRALAV
ncbi:MAG TPA: CBS domain-containing protein [Patescibacteria group bacterium]|jgi:CBS domain-containing protein|nr:CBS domain-containing protein [Patescibacteria group bacterium]